jgi:flagellar basal body P-ring formation protein FlgA
VNIPKLCLRSHPGSSWRWHHLCGALLPALLLALLAPAAAQTPAGLPAPVLAQALALVGDAAAVLAPKGARVQALPGALDARLTLAPCTRVQPHLPAGTTAWGRTRVGLRCAEGAVRWNVFLPVTVQVWAPAVTVVTALPAGTQLQAERLTLQETDWAATPQAPFADVQALVGRTLARGVGPGQSLHATDLQVRRWFASGETVRVVTQGPGFAVTAEGQALAEGVEGQPVRVRIGENHVAVGRAVGHRLVEVSL